MNFFRKPYKLRRYSSPTYKNGYASLPYKDITVKMDIQTDSNEATTTPSGTASLQKLRVFCDIPILVEDDKSQQKADRLYFQGKWFQCKSSRLSENTPLKHYTATFIELLDKEQEPNKVDKRRCK